MEEPKGGSQDPSVCRGPTLSPPAIHAWNLLRWRFEYAQVREVWHVRPRQAMETGSLSSGAAEKTAWLACRSACGRSTRRESNWCTFAGRRNAPYDGRRIVGAHADERCDACANGRNRAVAARSRDKGGMRGSDCPRERLDQTTYVPLAFSPGGVHKCLERNPRILRLRVVRGSSGHVVSLTSLALQASSSQQDHHDLASFESEVVLPPKKNGSFSLSNL